MCFSKSPPPKHNAHYEKFPRFLPTSKVLGIQCTPKTTNSSTKTLRPKCGYHVQKNQVKDLSSSQFISIHFSYQNTLDKNKARTTLFIP